jgi:hypothetical protein
MHPINIRADIGLSEQEMVLKGTKALNKLFKKKNIDKEVVKQIKQRIRTLKNRYRLFFKTKRHDFKTEGLY